jgi:hypothetical protein
MLCKKEPHLKLGVDTNQTCNILKLGVDTNQTCNILKLLVAFVLLMYKLKETSWI